MKVYLSTILVLHSFTSMAGRFEVQSGGKSSFYTSSPKAIQINSRLKCTAEESKKKSRIVSIDCDYKGTSFYTNEDCAADGSGFAILNINVEDSFSLIHHCDGTTIK